MAKSKSYASLTRQSDFLRLQKAGLRCLPKPWLIASFIKNPEGNFLFTVSVPKKMGSAVQRNRLKRWGREWFRKNHKIHQWKEGLLHIHFKPHKSYQYLFSETDEAFEKLNEWLQRIYGKNS